MYNSLTCVPDHDHARDRVPCSCGRGHARHARRVRDHVPLQIPCVFALVCPTRVRRRNGGAHYYALFRSPHVLHDACPQFSVKKIGSSYNVN